METRPYFLFGDILSNTLLGATVGALAAVCVSESWPMLVAMVVGMAAAMLIAAVFGAVLGIFFGAFEVMVPMMLTGMVAGMVIPMRAATQPLELLPAATEGAAIGLLALAATYMLNAVLRGKERQWTP
jgi:F0F1-type ATP synthase assembly protein I